jgi:hypothetical protein
MDASSESLLSRISCLERQNRQFRTGLVAFGVLVLLGLTVSRPGAQQSTDPLRVRGLIIEDGNGRPRVTIGAPLPVDGRTTNVRTGIRINDPNGIERFALYLMDNGRMGMGFDAPPGKGDDRNRERINIVADENGGAQIRFLDRRTTVPARIYLDDQNQVWVEFSDYTQEPPNRRRIGLTGEETLRSRPK